MRAYEILDVLVERSDGSYRTRIVSSPAGQATADFTLPFSPVERRDLRARLSGQTQPEQESSALADLKRIGGRLFDAVFADQVLLGLSNSLAATRGRGTGLRLRFNLGEVPELADLPWEYIFDRQHNRFLALSTDTPVVRYLDLPLENPTLEVTPPLKMLAVMASPTDYDPLDVDQEWRRIRSALDLREARGQLVLHRLDAPTLDGLRIYLRSHEPHVLHFVGHGDFDARTQEGVLLFQDAEGKGQLVSAEKLATIVGNSQSLRLVTLNSCDGGRANTTDVFAGTAQRLVQQGLPAVIAMQFPVTDKAAIAFAQEFYGAVADGFPIDAALGEARVAMQGAGTELEWGTPVLYMRSPDGRLFEVEPVSAIEQRQNELRSMRQAAEAAEAVDTWDTAVERWEAVLSLAPGDSAARLRLAQARDQQTMRKVFVEGQQHEQAGNWRQAFDNYYRVVELGGDYNGVFRLLARVRRRLAEATDTAQADAQSNGVAHTQNIDPDLFASDRAEVLKALSRGKVVVFLGTDANLCGRPDGERWVRGLYLPSGAEVAEHLATAFGYQGPDRQDLVRVAEYVEITRDWGTLYGAVRSLLNVDSPPTPLHQFLARLPAVLRAKGYTPAPQFIVTANFDDALERAFQRAHEPYDLLLYSRQPGAFWHQRHGEDNAQLIKKPNEYVDLPADRNQVSTVIVKIHGAFDRKDETNDSYVITEDNYIEYSSRILSVLPAAFAAALSAPQALFVGYSMRDWHLRVFLQPMWPKWGKYAPWVMPWNVDAFDKRFWGSRNAKVFDVPMDESVAGLSDGLRALAPALELASA